ncbi:Putative porin [Ekhidna lutea]|uniref:Putative porin n=1 Tax=Ekhidna lutea TaxID=447679 RepID=A0A239H7U9_EKHLU|nr:Putative porin [Ekhidna lutea]
MHFLHEKQSLNLRVRIYLYFITVLIVSCLSAQIVDDSTKLVYGPETTTFTSEFNLVNNIESYQPVDTSIYLFERQSYVDQTGRKFQSLGNFGTALFPIFYTPQDQIGRTSGFNAYDRYAYQLSDVKYYDTKSPFIELLVYLGGGNRNIVDIGFSRNVNENWNLGFDIRKITTNKQLAPENQTDRQVIGSSFVGYTHYKHSSIPYQVLANYSSMSHKVVELGGARPTSDSLRTDFFLFDNALVRLDEAQAIVKTARFHLYQDLQIADQFQLYHTFDYRKESNIYKDFAGGSTADGYNTYNDFYDQFLIDTDSTQERSVFTSVSNEAGLKGDLSSVFYRFYARLRAVDFNYLLYDPGGKTVEKYLGGYVRFDWKDKFAVSGNAQFLVGGEYQLGGDISSDLINVSYTSKKYRVPFVYLNYFGNHHEWHNDFSSVFSNELKGQLNLDFKHFDIRPKVKLAAYNNFIYFDQEIEPQQASDGALISSLGGDFNLRFLNSKGEGWHLENEVLVTNVSGGASQFVRLPDVWYNGRYFWRGKWFDDLVPVEFGVDAHARSAYYGNAYAPEIQQFYLQDEQEIFGYAAANLFVNMKVDKFFFSLKWTHFNQPQDDGYFATPNYPGQPKAIDLIIRWMFFD